MKDLTRDKLNQRLNTLTNNYINQIKSEGSSPTLFKNTSKKLLEANKFKAFITLGLSVFDITMYIFDSSKFTHTEELRQRAIDCLGLSLLPQEILSKINQSVATYAEHDPILTNGSMNSVKSVLIQDAIFKMISNATGIQILGDLPNNFQ